MEETEQLEAPLRTCRCGFHKHDLHVTPRCRYGVFAVLRLMMGVTAYPYEVRYQCERCGEVIETTNDPEILRLQV